MKEKTTTARVYEKDIVLLNYLTKDHKNIETTADAIRVCVEFANAHGVFS